MVTTKNLVLGLNVADGKVRVLKHCTSVKQAAHVLVYTSNLPVHGLELVGRIVFWTPKMLIEYHMHVHPNSSLVLKRQSCHLQLVDITSNDILDHVRNSVFYRTMSLMLHRLLHHHNAGFGLL